MFPSNQQKMLRKTRQWESMLYYEKLLIFDLWLFFIFHGPMIFDCVTSPNQLESNQLAALDKVKCLFLTILLLLLNINKWAQDKVKLQLLTILHLLNINKWAQDKAKIWHLNILQLFLNPLSPTHLLLQQVNQYQIN